MFALDLFNTDHERRIAEGAVDQLEQRRIDDLAMRMDDLVARAKKADTPEAKQALMKEFQKCKAERDSYHMVRNETMGYGALTGEGQVTPTATGIKHHAKPGVYGGFEKEKDPLAKLDKGTTNSLEKAMGIKFDRQKKYQGGLDVDEGGIPGNVPVEKIPGKEDLLKGRGRNYYEADQKKNADNENNDDWYDEDVEEGYAASIGPDVAPLPPEKQWRIQVRQLIADYIKNPQGLYNIAKQKGANSAEAAAYKYIMHPTSKIALPANTVTFEGYQDFDKVEPYEVCLAGKCVKTFDYYEDARRFHDNWKKKLYREGDKAKADKITLNPVMKEEEQKHGLDIKETKADPTGSWVVYNGNKVVKFKTHPGAKVYAEKNGGKVASSEFYADKIQKSGVTEGDTGNLHADLADVYSRMAPGIERHRDSFKAGQLYDALEAVAEQHNAHREFTRMMSGARNRAHMDYDTNPGGFQNWFWYLPFAKEELEEGLDLINMSDLQFYKELLGVMIIPVAAFGAMAWHKAMNAIKLYRAEDVITALQKKGVTVDRSTLEQIKPLLLKLERAIDVDKDGDVAKELAKRIQQTVTWGKLKQVNPDTTVNRKSEIVEEQDTSGVERAILNRIMTAHTDLLMKFGPDKVMQAAEEVAYNVGDVDEIGTSDVSAYVNQVRQILGA